MKRRLFNLAAAVSLLLCLATVGLWGRSYSVADALRYARSSSYLSSGRGVIHFVLLWDPSFDPHQKQEEGLYHWRSPLHPKQPSPYRTFDFLGFSYTRVGNSWMTFGVPIWFLMVLFILVPASWLVSQRRACHRKGLCPKCGYDLRATPDRCPECGNVPTMK